MTEPAFHEGGREHQYEMTTTELNLDAVKQAVRQHYGQVAVGDNGCGCAPTCCGRGEDRRKPDAVSQALGYSPGDIGHVPEGANLGLGCGNPLVIASLKAGQTVLDLGSGAGFDAFLAAK